jgi:hypothetical protein
MLTRSISRPRTVMRAKDACKRWFVVGCLAALLLLMLVCFCLSITISPLPLHPSQGIADIGGVPLPFPPDPPKIGRPPA